MIRKFVFIGFFVFSIASLWPLTASPAQAAGTVSVIGSNVSQNSTQPVNITSKGIALSITANPQFANSFCWPIQSTINSSTVTLSSATDHRVHPLYTVSWSKKSELISTGSDTTYYSKFTLSIPQLGYELKPNTLYELKLNGGPEGIEFSCQDNSDSTSLDNYFLPSEGYKINFSTGPDDIAPAILDQPYTQLNTHNTAVFGWITSELAKTQVRFGTTLSYGTTKSIPGNHEKHIIEINDLQPGTTYYYQLQSKDADGTKTATKTGSFTTWSISPITLSEITGHEASIKWTTTPATDSIIEYGTDQSMRSISGKHGITANHDVRLVHLKSNQTYYARIKLINGEAVSTSNTFSFKTLDASAGVTSNPQTLNPNFNSQFDLSNFNFKDFPEEVLSENDNQSSQGAILAATDNEPASIAGNYGSIVEQHRWVIWLWVPVMLLLLLIACIWLLHRHQDKTNATKQEIVKAKTSR